MNFLERQELFKEYQKGGISQKGLAEKYKITRWAVRKIIKEGEKLVSSPPPEKIWEGLAIPAKAYDNIKQLRSDGYTYPKIGEMYALRCKPCSLKVYKREIKWPPTKDLLRAVQGSSYDTMSRILGVSYKTLKRYLEEAVLEEL